MKDLIEKLEPIDAKTRNLNVIIETPKGSRIKYAYEPASGFLVLCKSLPEGMMFPFNFGFVPKTLSPDGDALDVLLLNDEPLIPGCLLFARPLAVIKATQTEAGRLMRNDRIIAQALTKEEPLKLLPMQLRKEAVAPIEFFFKSYNALYGKKFKVLGTGGRVEAEKTVQNAIRAYQKRQIAQGK